MKKKKDKEVAAKEQQRNAKIDGLDDEEKAAFFQLEADQVAHQKQKDKSLRLLAKSAKKSNPLLKKGKKGRKGRKVKTSAITIPPPPPPIAEKRSGGPAPPSGMPPPKPGAEHKKKKFAPPPATPHPNAVKKAIITAAPPGMPPPKPGPGADAPPPPPPAAAEALPPAPPGLPAVREKYYYASHRSSFYCFVVSSCC